MDSCTVCFKGKNQRFSKKILSGGFPKGTRSEEKISKNVDFSLWGNRATTESTFFDIFKSVKTQYGEKKWDQNHENHT